MEISHFPSHPQEMNKNPGRMFRIHINPPPPTAVWLYLPPPFRLIDLAAVKKTMSVVAPMSRLAGTHLPTN